MHIITALIIIALCSPSLLTAPSLCAQSCTQPRLLGACGLKPCQSCCKPACMTIAHTLFLPRSPHANSSYFLNQGRQNLLEIVATCVEAGYAYDHSFLGEDIAICLVGQPILSFQGSLVTTRTATDYLADQFGLSPFFQGTITLTPQIINHSLHLQSIWYGPNDRWCGGFFVRGQLSATHQERTLFSRTCVDPFTTINQGPDLPPGDMASTAVAAVPGLQQALSGTATFGEMQTPWTAGHFFIDTISDTQLSGITLDIGYSAIHDVIQDFSLFMRYRAPVGTHINGKQKGANSLFFPIIGDGKHQQFGAGGSFSGELWSDDTGRSVVVHAQAYATHPFANKQLRSFDLLGHGPLSRYLLLKIFDTTSSQPLSELIPAINITTVPVRVTLPAIGELAIQMLFKSTHATFTVGYELYGQKGEKLKLCATQLGTPGVSYGIKGCTGTTYFNYGIDDSSLVTAPSDPFAMPLNATASGTTSTQCGIVDTSGGTTTLSAGSVGVAWQNTFFNDQNADSVSAGTPTSELSIATTSEPPVFLTTADIDLCSGTAPHQIVHKGLLAVMYTWDRSPAPYLSFGFSAEGSGAVCALKQWSIWLKAGCVF